MYCKGGANLTTAKSGRILFLDVLSAVPPFSQGTSRSLWILWNDIEYQYRQNIDPSISVNFSIGASLIFKCYNLYHLAVISHNISVQHLYFLGLEKSVDNQKLKKNKRPYSDVANVIEEPVGTVHCPIIF